MCDVCDVSADVKCVRGEEEEEKERRRRGEERRRRRGEGDENRTSEGGTKGHT